MWTKTHKNKEKMIDDIYIALLFHIHIQTFLQFK
jgi:hypothetical protein